MSSEDKLKTTTAEALAASSTISKSNPETNTALSSSPDIILGMQTILEHVGAYIFIKDLAGRYTYVNQSVQELFGASFEDIIGQDDSHFFDLNLSDELMRNDRCVIEHE